MKSEINQETLEYDDISVEGQYPLNERQNKYYFKLLFHIRFLVHYKVVLKFNYSCI